MKNTEQLLLEQAYNNVHLKTIKSNLTTEKIRQNYSIVTIYSADVLMVVDALKKTGLNKQGVKVISREDEPLYTYLILPKTLWPELTDANRVQYAHIKMLEFTKPSHPKMFSVTGFTESEESAKLVWNEIIDKYHELTNRVPELEGVL